MRQPFPHQTIDKCSQDSTENDDAHYHQALTEQNEHGSRAGTSKGPAQPETSSANKVTGERHLFRGYANGVPIYGLHAGPFDQLDNEHTHHHGRSDHTIHMEGVEMEHFEDPVPGDDFGLTEDNSEKDTEAEIFNVFHYGKGSMGGLGLENQGKQEMGHDQAADEESNYRDQGGNLEVAEARDGMA